MKSRWPRILVFVFTALLTVVGVQTVWPVFPEGRKLSGVTAEPKPIQWSWAKFLEGDIAEEIDAWFNAHVGFRNFWVKLDNQVSYTFFGEVNPRKGTRIIAGAHDWLFEYQYIHTAVQRSEYSDADIATRVARLHAVQEKLARRGIPLLVVVAPSKVELYPEHVPAVYFGGRRLTDVSSNFERARPLMEAAGINFYDGPVRYAVWKAEGMRHLFARSGTHWSYISALRMLQELRGKLNPVMRHPIPEFQVTDAPVGTPRLIDLDLLDGANLLVEKPYRHELPFPKLKPQTEVPVAQLPRILWVHDSFGFVLFKLLYDANVVQPSEALYYFGKVDRPNILHLPGEADTGLPISDIDWESFLKSYDAIVIVWTEIAFDHEAWGFIKKLDESLN